MDSENVSNPFAERRRHVRYDADFTVEYRHSAQDPPTLTRCENICLGGVMLFSPEPFAVGESLQLALPFRWDDKDGKVELEGAVIWSDDSPVSVPGKPEVFRTGVQFLNVQAHQFAQLEIFIQRFCKGA